jgi:hypothetical protein
MQLQFNRHELLSLLGGAAAACDGARGIQQTLVALISFAQRAFDRFCDRNTTANDFLEALRSSAPQLSQFFFTKLAWTQEAVPMRESLGSKMDTAPYTEWLAIVCSIMVAVLFCAAYSQMAS